MMELFLKNRDGSEVTSDQLVEWSKLAKEKKIDLAKFCALLLMISVDPSPECRQAFEAVMYQLAMLVQCEGRLTLTSGRFDTIDAASIELASLLAPDSDNTDRGTNDYQH